MNNNFRNKSLRAKLPHPQRKSWPRLLPRHQTQGVTGETKREKLPHWRDAKSVQILRLPRKVPRCVKNVRNLQIGRRRWPVGSVRMSDTGKHTLTVVSSVNLNKQPPPRPPPLPQHLPRKPAELEWTYPWDLWSNRGKNVVTRFTGGITRRNVRKFWTNATAECSERLTNKSVL